MTDEKSRLAARADVETALREAADLAAHALPGAPHNAEIVALAAELLEAYRWHLDRRSPRLIPAMQALTDQKWSKDNGG